MPRIQRRMPVPHLITLADLSPAEIEDLVHRAMMFKHFEKDMSHSLVLERLHARTIALIFSKRSTRTRVSSESAIRLLGGHPMFLGRDDIQLGVNESLEDSAKVIGSMTDGLVARVGPHSDIVVSDKSFLFL